MAQISIIKKKDVLKGGRLDAEYFKSEYLEVENKIKSWGYKTISDLAGGCVNYGLNVDPFYTDVGIKFIRAQNLKEFGFEGEILNIPYSKEDLSERELLQTGDLMIVRSGANVGDIGIITDEFKESSFGSYIIKFDVKDHINPYFVYIFLKTKYGRLQTVRFRSGAAQPNISIPNLNKILVPILNSKFQKDIENDFFKAKEKQEKAKTLYKKAEKILLEEFGLIGYKTEHALTFEVKRKDIESVKRFDAEYFQPKYEDIIKKIHGYKMGFANAEDILIFNKKNFFPKEDVLYNYLPLSKVSGVGDIDVSERELGRNLPTRARRRVQAGEVILSSIKGSLESSALIQQEHNNMIVSTGFYVFHSNKINSETLLILFKSRFMLELLERISKGAILGGYDLESFEKIKIPLVRQKIQKQIAEKIQESHKLRKESKKMLESAKKKVEEEIEKA